MDHQYEKRTLGVWACHCRGERCQPRGMTLLEAVISTAVIGVIVLVVFTTLSREGKIASEQMVEINMQATLRRCTDVLVDELTDVHLIALSSEARWVDYNRPMMSRLGTPVVIDGETVYGAYDTDGSFHENWFYHLEAVNELADGVYVTEADWGQNVDAGSETANTGLLYFTPVRFELTTYRREKTATVNELMQFNPGDAANETARMAVGNARLQCSAVLDTPTRWDQDTSGPTRRVRCTRTLAVRCFRDSTVRAAAPWDKGEGIFYQRAIGRATGKAPMLMANTVSDSNANGYLDAVDLPTVAQDVYPGAGNAPLVYKNRVFEADIAPTFGKADTCENSQVNNVVDTAEQRIKGAGFWHRLRLVLFVVSGGKDTDVPAQTRTVLGLSGNVQGVNRVICAQTLVHLTTRCGVE